MRNAVARRWREKMRVGLRHSVGGAIWRSQSNSSTLGDSSCAVLALSIVLGSRRLELGLEKLYRERNSQHMTQARSRIESRGESGVHRTIKEGSEARTAIEASRQGCSFFACRRDRELGKLLTRLSTSAKVWANPRLLGSIVPC